jgi:histidine triad (HIT) family protein
MADDCLFCRIVRKEIPATIVAENDHCVAFRDINPQAPTHILVIPRRHMPSLNQLEDREVAADLLLLASQIARDQGIADAGYRSVINTNSQGGQLVNHLHLHLLGGRQMTWPPG